MIARILSRSVYITLQKAAHIKYIVKGCIIIDNYEQIFQMSFVNIYKLNLHNT